MHSDSWTVMGIGIRSIVANHFRSSCCDNYLRQLNSGTWIALRGADKAFSDQVPAQPGCRGNLEQDGEEKAQRRSCGVQQSLAELNFAESWGRLPGGGRPLSFPPDFFRPLPRRPAARLPAWRERMGIEPTWDLC